MPHSMEAEQAVIGSMLMDRDAMESALEILQPDDFYGRQYGTLFQAIRELNTENKPVDLVTLQERLKENNVPEELSLLLSRCSTVPVSVVLIGFG